MAGEDPLYTAWLRERLCRAPHNCGLRGEVHHPRHDATGPVGMGRRAHDHAGVPLCRPAHEGIELHRGPFAGWDKYMVREWLDEQAAQLRRAYLSLLDSRFPR